MSRKYVAIALLVVLNAIVANWVGCSKKNPSSPATPAGGNGTISGTVIRSIDSVAIYGVAVRTVPATSTLITNADGRYTIRDVPAGSYAVIAGLGGYTSDTVNVTVTASNTSTADFSLAVAPPSIELLPVPAGSFSMGSDSADPYFNSNEWPRHTVTLNAYQISKYPVTNSQYQAFINDCGYTTQNYWSADGWAWRTANNITAPLYWTSHQYNSGTWFPNHPVVGVSWYEADAFARWLGLRLPTEAEYEHASRGTDHRFWPWGNTWDDTRCNSNNQTPPDTFAYSSPVGFFTNGVSTCGAYDMVGNVCTWCSDWWQWDYYTVSPGSNPAGPATGTDRVIRNGGWGDIEYGCRSAARGNGTPSARMSDCGFRIAK